MKDESFNPCFVAFAALTAAILLRKTSQTPQERKLLLCKSNGYTMSINNKTEYEAPELEIVILGNDDILIVSGTAKPSAPILTPWDEF